MDSPLCSPSVLGNIKQGGAGLKEAYVQLSRVGEKSRYAVPGYAVRLTQLDEFVYIMPVQL